MKEYKAREFALDVIEALNNRVKILEEENLLLKASEQAAIQSQKEQFAEMDKQIQELKDSLLWHKSKYEHIRLNEEKLKSEILRLKGKIKEEESQNECSHEKTHFKNVRCNCCDDCGELIEIDI